MLFRSTSKSDGFGQVLSIISFVGRLGEECQVQTGAFDKGIQTYNFSAILEIIVAGLDRKATRLIVSRHSKSNISGSKVSK